MFGPPSPALLDTFPDQPQHTAAHAAVDIVHGIHQASAIVGGAFRFAEQRMGLGMGFTARAFWPAG